MLKLHLQDSYLSNTLIVTENSKSRKVPLVLLREMSRAENLSLSLLEQTFSTKKMMVQSTTLKLDIYSYKEPAKLTTRLGSHSPKMASSTSRRTSILKIHTIFLATTCPPS